MNKHALKIESGKERIKGTYFTRAVTEEVWLRKPLASLDLSCVRVCGHASKALPSADVPFCQRTPVL